MQVSEPAHQEQPGADRRSGRGQDRHRAEGLAQKISVNGDVPEPLMGKTGRGSLDLGRHGGRQPLSAATLKSGSKTTIEENSKTRPKARSFSFIDEIHNVVELRASLEGAMDASNMMKPALARGELRCVGATTINEYRKYIEKDAALERRFAPVLVSEPTVEDTISILRGLKERYEVHHHVVIKDSALVAAATLSNRYITDRFCRTRPSTWWMRPLPGCASKSTVCRPKWMKSNAGCSSSRLKGKP